MYRCGCRARSSSRLISYIGIQLEGFIKAHHYVQMRLPREMLPPPMEELEDESSSGLNSNEVLIIEDSQLQARPRG